MIFSKPKSTKYHLLERWLFELESLTTKQLDLNFIKYIDNEILQNPNRNQKHLSQVLAMNNELVRMLMVRGRVSKTLYLKECCTKPRMPRILLNVITSLRQRFDYMLTIPHAFQQSLPDDKQLDHKLQEKYHEQLDVLQDAGAIVLDTLLEIADKGSVLLLDIRIQKIVVGLSDLANHFNSGKISINKGLQRLSEYCKTVFDIFDEMQTDPSLKKIYLCVPNLTNLYLNLHRLCSVLTKFFDSDLSIAVAKIRIIIKDNLVFGTEAIQKIEKSIDCKTRENMKRTIEHNLVEEFNNIQQGFSIRYGDNSEKLRAFEMLTNVYRAQVTLKFLNNPQQENVQEKQNKTRLNV